jgi:molybdopterin synthase catalytic subunit
MAVQQLKRIAREAAMRWPLHAVCIEHRVGECPVAEASVVVAVSSVHRREAFEACEWIIDTLKARVPIWKQEWFEGGTGVWKANCPRCAHHAGTHHSH